MDDLGILFNNEIGAPSLRPGAATKPSSGSAVDKVAHHQAAPNPFDTDTTDVPAATATKLVTSSVIQQFPLGTAQAAIQPVSTPFDSQASAAATRTGPGSASTDWANFDTFGASVPTTGSPAQPAVSTRPPAAPSMKKQASGGGALSAATIVQASVMTGAGAGSPLPYISPTTTATGGAKAGVPGRLSTDSRGGEGRGSRDSVEQQWEQSNPAWAGSADGSRPRAMSQGTSRDSRGATVVRNEAPDPWNAGRSRAGTGGSRTSRDSADSSPLEFGGRSYASRSSRNTDDLEEGNPSYAPPTEPSDHLEGTVFVRASAALVLKAWRPAWAQLRVGQGQITVWESKEAKLTGEPPIQMIELGPGMGLSSMKVATPGSAVAGSTGLVSLAAGMYSAASALVKAESGLPPRIYYRHVADIGIEARKLDAQAQAQAANAAAAANGNSSVRVWKFGLDSQAGFTRWSKAIRDSIDLLAKDEQSRASRAAVMDSAISASDFLRSAISSPPAASASHGLPTGRTSRGGTGGGRDEAKEKESVFVFGKSNGQSGEEESGYAAPLNLSVYLLDGTEVHLNPQSLKPTQHTPPDFEPSVHNICLALKRHVGVQEDADFSLFLATVPPDVPNTGGSQGTGGMAGWGGHSFVCLPDVMSAREAQALANAQITGMSQGRGGAAAGPALGIGSGLAMSPPPLGGRPLPSAALVYRRRGYMPSSIRPHGAIPTLTEYYCYTPESLQQAQSGCLEGAPSHKPAPSFDLLGLVDSTPAPAPVYSGPIKLGDMLPALFSGLDDKYVCPGGLPPFDAEALHDFSADPDADQTPGAGTGALRLSFLESSYLFTTGYHYIPVLDQCITLAALHLIAVQGPLREADGEQNNEWYRRQIGSLLPASAVQQHRATSGLGADGLAAVLKERHHKLSAAPYSIIPGQARRLYVQRCAACPEYGGTAFVGELCRYIDNSTSTSKTAAPTPAWLAALTQEAAPRDSREDRNGGGDGNAYRSSRRAADGPEPAPVQFTLCHLGLLVRPLPPRHPAASSYSYSSYSQAEGPVSEPFYLHPITHIEIWGTKKHRPVFTYRVRERGGGICVELHSHQYREAASSLHATVFMLLAAKEGQARQPPRSAGANSPGASGAGMDSASMAAAAKAATRRAKAEALQHDPLPDGWTEIIDPTTGAMAYWNQQTKKTVFSRPLRA